MPQNLTDDISILVQEMAWYHRSTSHYLNQCWPHSVMPYEQSSSYELRLEWFISLTRKKPSSSRSSSTSSSSSIGGAISEVPSLTERFRSWRIWSKVRGLAQSTALKRRLCSAWWDWSQAPLPAMKAKMVPYFEPCCAESIFTHRPLGDWAVILNHWF